MGCCGLLSSSRFARYMNDSDNDVLDSVTHASWNWTRRVDREAAQVG